ncbi:MAG: energy-coupling factor ABC transporter permease [bacterium]
MHIPDGLVSGPINAATYVLSGAAVAWSVARSRRTLEERQVPLLGVTSAFVFAAQMLNFPIAGGTSGHFLGATLAAVLLGPANACLILFLVLLVQCLGFGDGGITALGTNVFNMGIVGGVGGYAVFRSLLAVLPKTRSAFLAAVAVASWCAVVAGAAACAVELGLSGKLPLRIALPAMAGVHVLIGIGEALITSAVVSLVLAVRPDLVQAWRPRVAATGLAAAAA